MTPAEQDLRARLQQLAEYARSEPPAEAVVGEELRRPRHAWTAGVAAAVLVVAAVGGVLVARRQGPSVVADGGLAALPGGTTDLLADAGLGGRSGAASVWTGREVLVWGGMASGSGGPTPADGAALDPVANRWRPLPPAPIGSAFDPAAVWTGREMLVWGGGSSDGAAFDPATNRWRTLAPNPFDVGSRPAVVWVGTEMLVVGGQGGGLRAAAYDPAGDRWRRVADPPGVPVGPYPQAVWTGTHAALVLWPASSGVLPPPGGPGPSSGPPGVPEPSPSAPPGTPPPRPIGSGPNADMFVATYSPTADRWSQLPAVAFVDGTIPRLVWTGRELLALQQTVPGAAFDPATQTWRPIEPIPTGVVLFAEVAWTGRHVLLWSGGERGLAYDPSGDAWSTFDAGGLDQRSDAVIVWAGDVLIGWGGGVFSAGTGRSGPASDGVRYRPPG